MRKSELLETAETISVVMVIDNISMAAAEISYLNKKLWYFNRLIVPPNVRGQGIASVLMKELIEVLDRRQITLACDINPYGDLNFDQLNNFYQKYGFVCHKQFNLIRYPKAEL